MKRIIFSNLVLILSLTFASCTQFQKASSQLGFERIELGTNLREEQCRLESGTILYETFFEAKRVLNVMCGGWEWPSARIFEVASKEDTLDSWYKNDSEWHKTLGRRMRCDPEYKRVRLFQEFDQIQFNCELNNGSLPYLALAIQINDSFYLADGIPAALPSIGHAIAAIAGIRDDTHALRKSPAVEYLRNQLEKRIYKAADLQQYYQAMTMGQYYNGIKEFSKAEKQYRNALKIHKDKLGGDNTEMGDVLIHLALELSNQEQFSLAEDHFRRADQKISPEDNSGDYIRSISYKALHLANQGQFEGALTQAMVARNKRKNNSKKSNVTSSSEFAELASIEFKELDPSVFTIEKEEFTPVETAHNLYVESAMLQQLGKLSESDETLREAQHVLSMAQEPPPLWEPQMDSLGGVVKESQDDLSKARQSHNEALLGFDEVAPRKRPSVLAHLYIGRSLLEENKVQDALKNFRQAIALASRGNNSFRLYQLAPFFEALLDNNKLSGEVEREANYREAFNAAQLVMSGKLTSDIARTVTRLGQRDDRVGRLISKLQRQQYQRLKIRQEVQAERQRILDQDHQGRLEKLESELDQIEKTIHNSENEMQQNYPEYLQLIGSPVKIDEVIEVLADDEGLLQILVGKTQSVVLFVHRRNVSAYSVAISENEIAKAVSVMREKISKGRQVEVANETKKFSMRADIVVENAHRLFDRLLKPIAKELEAVDHLVTIPSGPLLSFPFGLFVTESPPVDKNHTDYLSEVPWLARQTAISLVPSAQSFVYLRQRVKPSDAPKPLIAFGDFVADSNQKSSGRSNSFPLCQTDSKEVRQHFDPLPGTKKEIDAVAALFPEASVDDVFLNQKFTEEAVKAKARLKNYNIVYFATHAALPDQIECHFEPSLVTSLNASDSGAENGFLTANEILELELNADLVVLSACNTGGAETSGGDSLSGLARSFFFAGARKLLVSHWVVHDEATADLMELVFGNLKSDKRSSIAAALRKAQIEMMNQPRKKEWSNPFYWAAFTLVGDGAQRVSGI